MPINQVDVAKELSTSYLEYALSTVNRAIPNAIDGLLISHRRIINTMLAHGMTDWYKTASVSGMVIAERHPHGSCTGSIYNLISKASNMYPLLEGYGNMGGHIYEGEKAGQLLSDDNPAADRYTKAKLSTFALEVFDIEPEYLQTTMSYTNKHIEVSQYIPALPLALVNAQQSVGVGYACNSISFNLEQIAKAVKYSLDGDETNATKALGIPDLTSFSKIQQDESLLDLHGEGRASLKLIGEYSVKTIKLNTKRNSTRTEVLITELPTGSAERFLTKLKQSCDEYKITTLAEANDLSDGDGIKIQLIGKYGATEDQIVSELIQHTSLSTTYPVNNTFVVNGMPKLLTPYQVLQHWLEARKEVLKVKFKAECVTISSRLHILEALIDKLPLMRQIVQDIMESDTEVQAQQMLQAKYELSEAQSKAILSISLKQLVKLNEREMVKEQSTLKARLAYLTNMLNDPIMLNGFILNQVETIVKKFSKPRRTKLQNKTFAAAAAAAVTSVPQTARQTFLTVTKLNEALAKNLYKHYNKGTLPKSFRGQSLNKISDDLALSLDKLFKAKTVSHKSVHNWIKKYKLEPISDRQAKSIASDRARFEKYLISTFNKGG